MALHLKIFIGLAMRLDSSLCFSSQLADTLNQVIRLERRMIDWEARKARQAAIRDLGDFDKLQLARKLVARV